MRISYWSSDVCSSDLKGGQPVTRQHQRCRSEKPARSLERRNRLRAIAIDDFPQLGSNLLQRLLQRNTFKVSVRHSLQWMKQPLAAVVLFGRTGPLGADKAQRLRIVAVTTDRSNAAIGTHGYRSAESRVGKRCGK